jgi:hypothetical protein
VYETQENLNVIARVAYIWRATISRVMFYEQVY